jgi:hypothetical protein
VTNHIKLTAYPNPFTQMTEISFSGGHSAEGIELRIYDVTGRLVRSFDPDGLRTKGQWDDATIRLSDHITWDGSDELGNDCPPGVYILHVGAQGISKNLILIYIK